jgi:hypothetical protein
VGEGDLMTALAVFAPHDEVLVSWRHPRTKAPCKLSATVVSIAPSGRVLVSYTVEGRTFRLLTDPENVRAA